MRNECLIKCKENADDAHIDTLSLLLPFVLSLLPFVLSLGLLFVLSLGLSFVLSLGLSFVLSLGLSLVRHSIAALFPGANGAF